jgi:hypothetical protein
MPRKTTATTSPTTRKTTTTTRKRATPIPRDGQGNGSAREISYEMIARRAYEIFVSGTGGSQEENWYRAERELRGL